MGLALVLVAGTVLAIGPPAASADPFDPWIDWSVELGQDPATVTVHGDGWSGEGGVWLFQCSGYPGAEEFWQNCEQGSGRQVVGDPPWSVDDFGVNEIVDPEAQEPFPPGTVNTFGNGTFDCEAQVAHCGILAIQGDLSDFANATRAWANLGYEDVPEYVPYFSAEYGTASNPLTINVDGAMKGLRDGDELTVTSSGHRENGIEAMTYLCMGTGPAFPGGCDPVAGSLGTTDGSGEYSETVSLPRFVWVNDPFDNADWFDCVNGCSVMVGSAGNLGSPNSPPITFANMNVEQNPSVLSVTKAYVNRYGGINVNGLVDCKTAMAAWGLDDEAVAGGNISWTARQPVGRKGVVTGHYESAIASICHDPAGPGPYGWGTHPPITSSDTWWVYPDSGGKFVAGTITIIVRYDGSVWGDWWGAENYMLTGATQWNVKAIKK